MTEITYPTIGLAGAKRSGKNTVADMLTNIAGYRQYAFADELKRAALALDPLITYVDTLYQSASSPHSKLGHTNYPVRRLSEIVDVIGWERAKDEYPEVRRTLQRLGTEAGWQIHGEQLWTQRVHDRITRDAIADARDNIHTPTVITDVRFEEEESYIRSIDGIIIEIIRPIAKTDEDTEITAHSSETTTITADHIIVNDGTLDDLHAKVNELLHQTVLDLGVLTRTRP